MSGCLVGLCQCEKSLFLSLLFCSSKCVKRKRKKIYMIALFVLKEEEKKSQLLIVVVVVHLRGRKTLIDVFPVRLFHEICNFKINCHILLIIKTLKSF